MERHQCWGEKEKKLNLTELKRVARLLVPGLLTELHPFVDQRR